MSFRKLMSIAVVVSLATMLVTLYMNNRQAAAQPDKKTPPAAASTPASGPAAATSAPVAPPVERTAPAVAKTAPAVGTKPATPASASAPVPPAPAAPASVWSNPRVAPSEAVLGSLDEASGFKMQVRTTSLGAAIKTAKLTDYYVSVAAKKSRDPEGHFSVLNPVSPTPQMSYYPMATEQINFPALNAGLVLSGPRWQAEPVQPSEDPATHVKTQSIAYTTQIDRDGKPFVRIKKTYSLAAGSYSIGVKVEVTDAQESSDQPIESIKYSLVQAGPFGIPNEDIRQDSRTATHGVLDSGKVKVNKLSFAEAEKKPNEDLGHSDTQSPTVWVGVADKFFGAMLYLRPPANTSGLLAAPQDKAAFSARLAWDEGVKVYCPQVELRPSDLTPGKPGDFDMDLFVGPKSTDLFDTNPLYTQLNYRGAIDFGACCTFDWLSLGMIWLLEKFHYVTFGNYGWAIILLVLLVRLALHPLTKKSQVSMMGMQKLGPEMEKLKEKYKDDKAQLNAEMMKYYRQQGFTPILGCLPMALQMPIWAALYSGLSTAVQLRHAAFLPVWLTDLASPDALVHFTPFQIPLIGSMTGPIVSLNVLPILLGISMILQQKYTPTTAPTAGNAQAKSQKQMMYFMSGFMLLMFYNLPSGLNLYVMASTFGGVIEQIVIRKHIREKQALEAQTETAIDMPGGHFRGQRAKKPKGPYKF